MKYQKTPASPMIRSNFLSSRPGKSSGAAEYSCERHKVKNSKSAEIDHYIASFPPDVRSRLTKMRSAISKAAPIAQECISYRIPTWKMGTPLVHFAAYDRHIGFYPGPSGIAAFSEELQQYKHAKGSVQFPHAEPLPIRLIERIVAYRVNELAAKQSPTASTTGEATDD